MAVKTFTTGEVLTAADTNTYLNNGGLVWIATTDFGSTTTPFINGCFSSTYAHYRVLISAYGSVGSDVRLRLRYGTSTVENGAVYDRFGFASGATVAVSNAADQTSAFIMTTDATSTIKAMAVIDIFNPNIAANTNMMIQGWGANNGSLVFYNNRVQTTTQYTGLEMTQDSGTLVGRIDVYGYRIS